MPLKIVEGIAGYWFYHLREGDTGKALCGAEVMRTSIPLDGWARTPTNYHIPEKWCHHCALLGGLTQGPLPLGYVPIGGPR